MDSTTARNHLDAWLAADLAVAGGQSYTIGGRSLTRANSEEIRQQVQYWTQQLSLAQHREAGVKNSSILYSRWH